MIYIVDRFVQHHQHVYSNVSTIKILNEIYPESKFCFISEEKHNDLVKDHLKESTNISYKSYKNKKFGNSLFSRICRVVHRITKDLSFFTKILNEINRNKESFIFITHIYPISLIFFKFLKKMYPKVRVICTIHGEIEYLFNGVGKYQKLIACAYNLIFKIKNENFLYLFLTKVSKNILINTKKLQENEILTCATPTQKNIEYFVKQANSSILRIGHVGSAGIRKNVNLLYKLAESLKDEISKNSLELSIIGSLEKGIKPYMNTWVKDFVSGQESIQLERDVFNKELQNLDYCVFFYGKNDFILRNSGAFIDAINYEKPIIVLQNDFFEDVFKDAGYIGYICKDLEEMKNLVKKLLANQNDTQYMVLKKNIVKYKKSLNYIDVAKNLKEQLKGSIFI
jgi:hypothetical protein